MPDTLAPSNFVLAGGAGVPAELVDQARVDARAVGYAQGWSQGLREAAETQAASQAAARAELSRLDALHAQRLDAAVRAVHTAAGRLEETVVQLSDEIADRILSAGVELARALLGQELSDPVTRASAILNRVLRLAPDNEQITVWVSPADHETLTGAGGTELIAAVEAGTAARLSFECDPALDDGDAMARSAATSIDARLGSALERLREYAG